MRNQPFSITPTALSELCVRYGISRSDLAGLCGMSRSTAQRLVSGDSKLKEPQRQKLLSCLAKKLPAILLGKGRSKEQIDSELSAIFNGGEYQPMISQRVELSREALKFFGFDADPFSKAPESRDEVFISKDLQRVIDRVIDAIQYQGFIFVEGEIGSGKSTLRALVEDQLMENDNLQLVWPEFFDMKNVSPMQIAGALLEHFGINKLPGTATRRGNAVKSLLARLYKDGKRVGISFDEAHRLSDPVLSSLKNFLEMSSGGFQRYLAVLLFGQPIFTARLSDPKFREIHERITIVKMPDFGKSSADYLAHRLTLVGKDLTELFDGEAIDLICRQATTPLQIGNIANEALHVSMREFKEKRVIGAAIKTRMYFENNVQGFKLRKAS